jgi:5,5'-dehydrodivanillate O-demethylase oxygenase subunit
VLSREENELFTRVGPGTPMGEMLRRYWHPVGCSEHVTRKPQRTKVMGEEFVLYRGESGTPVFMQLRCAHRSLALDYGRVEGDCIRCPYHGWLYDKTGQCLEQPAEPEGSQFKEKIRLRSYPTQELSGIVFGYLGPQPAPLLPLYDILRRDDGVKGVNVINVSCNWFNHVENVVDLSHLPWLHGYTFPAYGGAKVSYRNEQKPYGADMALIIEGEEEEHIACYAFPAGNRFAGQPVEDGGELVLSFIYRVPIDDTSMLQYFVRFYPSAKRSFNTTRYTTQPGRYKPLPTDWWGIDVVDQDRMVTEQQGAIADRAGEHLGVSDGGVILMRQMMRESLKLVAAGRDPLCVIRDPSQQAIDFPQHSILKRQRRADVIYNQGFATPR